MNQILEYIPYIFYGLLAIGVIYILISKRRIQHDGTEVWATVSRVERQPSPDADDPCHTTDFYIVSYKKGAWETVEATLINPPSGLKVGSRVKIKFDPNNPKRAVVTEVLET